MTAPTISDFKTYFNRDFPYGSTTASVMDADITKALSDAYFSFNEALADSQSEYTSMYLNLAAHFLVMNLRASSQGIAGQYSFLQNTRAVGNVSEGVSIPQRILDNPQLAMFAKTNYGAKFLFMILPKLTGQIFIIEGTTQS